MKSKLAALSILLLTSLQANAANPCKTAENDVHQAIVNTCSADTSTAQLAQCVDQELNYVEANINVPPYKGCQKVVDAYLNVLDTYVAGCQSDDKSPQQCLSSLPKP